MHRLIELLIGLPAGFLSRDGQLSIQFHPQWPGQQSIGAGGWNFLLVVAAAALVFAVYRRDGRNRYIRIGLGSLRGLLLLLIILLLNRPIVTLSQSRTEPSVLAVMIDDSSSMRVPDEPGDTPRLAAAAKLFAAEDSRLLRDLSRTHELRFFKFDESASPVATVPLKSDKAAVVTPAIDAIKPTGQSTQVESSVLSVMQQLQGQRVAGVVVVSDGRDTPTRTASDTLNAIKAFNTRVYPVAMGTGKPPRDVQLQSMDVDDVAFKGDVVNVKLMLHGTGFEPGHAVTVVLQNGATGAALTNPDGSPATESVVLNNDGATPAELQWKPSDVGPVEVTARVLPQPGEIDDDNASRTARVSVVDSKISVLFVDGYPRWEYRYLKNEMIRDKSFDLSCLLTSADADFAQEGSRPIRRFPDSIEELLSYDVVVIGDVDPRYFTDQQLQLVSDFVNRRGGGLAMVAGPRCNPQGYRNTALEAVLPVSIGHVSPTDPTDTIIAGYRPVLTPVGLSGSLFRFFADPNQNSAFLKNDLQPLFWYCRGVTAKPGVGEVIAQHPTDTGPDGRPAPLLVLGRYGAGRTLFSAMDETWRWRFYTGESIFDTYWVEQLRYLARGRKIGQHKLSLSADQPTYELGNLVHLTLRVIDPVLGQQLPDVLRVQLNDEHGQPIKQVPLTRRDGQSTTYSGAFPADRVGRYTAALPAVTGGDDTVDTAVQVVLPRLEMADPTVDTTSLSRLASQTLGKPIDFRTAASDLLKIPSAERVIPILTGQPLWSAPLVLIVFALLITAEWVARKWQGMV